jgi:hypothetical protein
VGVVVADQEPELMCRGSEVPEVDGGLTQLNGCDNLGCNHLVAIDRRGPRCAQILVADEDDHVPALRALGKPLAAS